MNRWIAVVAVALNVCPLVRGQAEEFKPADIDAAVMRHSLGQFWGGVVVGKGGKVVFAKGYGVANEELTPIEADTLFDIGSISKQFTAAGILRLEMERKLGLEDPVAKFYPELDVPAGDRAKAVTLKHLLTHTSGMTDQRAIQRLDFPDRDEAVKKAFEAEPSGKVGEKFEYCNAGYIVLAAVIEKASGRKFEEFMREEVFKRAGLTSTGFLNGVGLNPAKQTLRVISARSGGRERRAPLFTSPMGEPWAWGLKGAGGVLTTMEDMVRWDAALRGESVLNAAAREKLYWQGDGGYALGWFVEPTPSGNTKVHHGGATRGFRAQLSRYLEDDVVVAVLTNESGDLTGIEKAVTKVVFKTVPSVELEMRVGELPMNKYRAVDIQNGLRCVAGKDRERVRVMVLQGDATIANFWVHKRAAGGLLADVKRMASGSKDDAADCGAMLGTMPYQAAGDGVIHITSELTWRVMKEYSGVNPDTGQRTVDKRLTLVVMDEEKGFWPLIVKMNAKAAAEFAGQLEGAVE